MDQGSPEWFEARRGKLTASRIADIMAKTKSGPSASRSNYATQLVCERVTGTIEPGFTSAAMQWGVDQEPNGRLAYEVLTGATVDLAGFVDHPSIAMSGASPDGFVGANGLIEIKCPNTATHVETMLTGKIASKYLYQMQWQIVCTGRDWCDFVSYDPRLGPGLDTFIKRVPRDADMIAAIETEARAFLDEVAAMVSQLEQRRK
jgi:putative phage-type endonuclease